MVNPVFSICIPTRNRAEILEETLSKITKDECFLNTDKIEIVISDNCSDDNTQNICLKYKQMFADKINYIRQEHDLHDKNFIEVLKCAKGKYAKLNNDTLSFRPDALKKIVSVLETHDKDVIFISGRPTKNNELEVVDFKNFDEFLNYISYDCTWIGGLCVKTDKYTELESPDRFSHLNFAQIDIIARLANENKISVINGDTMELAVLSKKGGYNICEIFGQNLLTILQQLKSEGYLSNKTYNKVVKNILLKHINSFHFDYNNNYAFTKGGYFKYLFKYYKSKPYYYTNYLLHLLRLFFRLFIRTRKDETHKIIKLLGFIKIKIRRSQKYDWAKHNKHNFTTLAGDFQAEKITVGKGTYGQIDARFSSNGNEKLIIGNYCSIANGVVFAVSAEHNYKNLSTYPFKVHYLGHRLEAGSKGDIVVKDDVWIGINALILSGVTIGQGAIIGAGAVVTKDVPPYAIVGGNPAKVIKYRFEPEIIEKLNQFNFAELSEDKIKKFETKLYTKITKDNIDNLLKDFSSDVQ